ncbi:MAG: urease accessory protein UreE [Steroidobacteraceae bacterium]
MAQLTISTRAYGEGRAAARLVLPFELRQRSRMVATMDNGEEVGLILPRGTVLRGGDRLQGSDGRLVEVVAAPEHLSIVRSSDARLIARAAYHLGNRHIAVQITAESIRYLKDHVLDDMLRGLGLKVTNDILPFEPEAGAYSSSHANAHAHGHAHDHD